MNISNTTRKRSLQRKNIKPVAASQSTVTRPWKKRAIIRRLWVFHFLVGLTVVFSGIYCNGGNKKYVPIDVKALSKEKVHGIALSQEQNCLTAYVNVHADSSDEHGAIICCRSRTVGIGKSDVRSLVKDANESLLCASKLSRLPFASTLTRIRDSWLFPVLPLLLRIIITSVSYLSSNDNNNQSNTILKKEVHVLWWSSWRRLFIYFLIMNFRGWGLYIFLNMIQKAILTNNNTSAAITSLFSFTNTFMTQSSDWRPTNNATTCWYQNLLRSKNRHAYCYGRSFDFSDHMVLFFGQTLPVMLFEILFCVVCPFWKHPHHHHDEECNDTTIKKDSDSSSTKYERKKNYHILYKVKHTLLPWAIILFLLFLFLYFNVITLIAAHKTAAYFHTPGEIIMGYCVSLIIQLPLGFLICFYNSSALSENQLSYWSIMRQFVGLHVQPRREKKYIT